MRKTLKVLHTISAAGLIGGLASYIILLVASPAETPAAYADLRQSIAAISNYVLLPSLAIALISGLIAMAVHRPFLDKGWVWAKAAMGILMFKGVLTVVGAKADYAATMSERIASGQAPADALDTMLVNEWYMLIVIMLLSVANVVLGIWRPRRLRRERRRSQAPAADDEAPDAEAVSTVEPVRPAA